MMFKSMVWMILSGAKRRICYERGMEFSHFGGNEKILPKSNPNFQLHAVFYHMRYAEYLNLEGTNDIKFTLPPSSNETISKVDKLLKNLDKSRPLVVISPATTWKLKHWNKDNWKAIVRSISKNCNIPNKIKRLNLFKLSHFFRNFKIPFICNKQFPLIFQYFYILFIKALFYI